VDPEDAYHALMHLAANAGGVAREAGGNPAADRFRVIQD
jgi:hypothetical protein